MKYKFAFVAALGLAGIGASYSALHAQEAGMRSVWDGVYTFDQAERGETAYREQCMRCHGRFLDGDSLAPPLQSSIFLSSWDGVPLDKLYVRISRDMSENNAGKMNAEVNAAMLAYLLAFNGFPDAKTELPHTVDKLSQIRFEQMKPEHKQ